MTGYNFGNGVRRILAEAQDLAVRLDSPAVTPEHLLLALISPDSESFTQLVEDLNVLPAQIAHVRASAEERLRELPPTRSRSPDRPYTAGAKHLLELAIIEAHELRAPTIEKEHLLAGYLRGSDGSACDQLALAGITLERVRPWVRARFKS